MQLPVPEFVCFMASAAFAGVLAGSLIEEALAKRRTQRARCWPFVPLPPGADIGEIIMAAKQAVVDALAPLDGVPALVDAKVAKAVADAGAANAQDDADTAALVAEKVNALVAAETPAS